MVGLPGPLRMALAAIAREERTETLLGGASLCSGRRNFALRRHPTISRSTTVDVRLNSEKTAREIGDRRGEGADLGNLGNAYARLGEKEAARRHLLPGLLIVRAMENQDAAMIERKIGEVRKKLGKRNLGALLQKVMKELGMDQVPQGKQMQTDRAA